MGPQDPEKDGFQLTKDDSQLGTNNVCNCSKTDSHSTDRYAPSCLQRFSNGIIYYLETFFYRLGVLVGRHPWLTILISLLICGLCGIGLIKFEQVTDDSKLWVPKTSRVLPEKRWADKNFPEDIRFTTMILYAPNILNPSFINSMYDLYLKSIELQLPGNVTLDDMCVKIGPTCYVSSLLELWRFDEQTIRSLDLTTVLRDVNSGIQYSPVFGRELDLEYLFGGIVKDYRGHIIGAKTVSLTWTLHKDPQYEVAALDWEKRMIDLANQPRPYVERTYVYATRTFDDEGYGAVNADTSLLTAGFIIVFLFIIFVLGRCNIVENKLYLSLIGILTIGLAVLFCYGIAMTFGFIYGPIHSVMPFLILGVGVDDMFVIVGAWENLTKEERKKSIPERIGLSLKHAGVSITVTSITDIVAFGIGGSTVIPALSAFCAYASLGILGLYLLASTFFVACFTLDQQRIEANRNSVFCCFVHKNYQPNSCSQKNLVQLFMQKVYGPFLMALPTKIVIILITIGVTSVNVWSFTQLRQDFDLYNYIPDDSYAQDFIKTQQKFYPDRGYESTIYCDGMDYYDNRNVLEVLSVELGSEAYIEYGSVKFWFPAYLKYLTKSRDPYVMATMDRSNSTISREDFYTLLPYFLQQPEGRAYGQYLKFDNSTPPNITASYIPFIHTRQLSSAGDIDAMESVRDLLDNTPFIDGKCFSYGFKYLNNELNKILHVELYRNLALAGVCVFLVTLLLIANLWTSILVFTCVAFTVINVVGSLQFLGVTIDTASSILITICVGLAVDYSAHVGHMFMTLDGSREERAKKSLVHIGPAVLNGGISTFLAFVLLVNSRSFGFMLFFRVFMLVVLFGLFHGLVYLPVILSWWGPEPYPSALETGNQSADDSCDSSEEHKEMLPIGNHGNKEDCPTRNGNGKRYCRCWEAIRKAWLQLRRSDTHGNSVNKDTRSDKQSFMDGHCHGNQHLQTEDIVDSVIGASGRRLLLGNKERCGKCDRTCALCYLELVQTELANVLQHLRLPDDHMGCQGNSGGGSQYCSCDLHRHRCPAIPSCSTAAATDACQV